MTQIQTPVALTGVRNVTIDERALRTHELRPAHVVGVSSSRGLHDDPPSEKPGFFGTAPYHFDVDGFGKALHAALKSSVNGYVMRLRRHGTTIYTLQWELGKTSRRRRRGLDARCPYAHRELQQARHRDRDDTPAEREEASRTTPRSPATCPSTWAKGPQRQQDHVPAPDDPHARGSDFNVQSSASDYGFMKSKVAAGTTHLRQYWYQNMNFGLCRILISHDQRQHRHQRDLHQPRSPELERHRLGFRHHRRLREVRPRPRVRARGRVGADSRPSPADALAYSFPVNGAGWNSGDLSTMTGGAGWHMSADELLNVMGTLRRKGTIMSTTQAQTMLDSGFGIDVSQSHAARHALQQERRLGKRRQGRADPRLFPAAGHGARGAHQLAGRLAAQVLPQGRERPLPRKRQADLTRHDARRHPAEARGVRTLRALSPGQDQGDGEDRVSCSPT